jgi:hypothetical protein
VPDVQNFHTIIVDAIEDLVGVPDERRHMHARPLNYGRTTFGMLPYLRNDFLDANLNGRGYHFAEGPAVCGNFMEIGGRAFRVFNFHAVRNDLNAASTSSSVATPLRSASSIAFNSSGVA